MQKRADAMHLATPIKTCNVATVTNGWVQTTDNGAVFIEYLPKAKGLTFSVDARSLLDATQVLNPDFHIIVKDDGNVFVFDEEQEITLQHQRPDIQVQRPTSNWQVGNIASPWMVLADFTSAQFPAVRTTPKYLEALTHESIVRLEHDLELPLQDVMTYKIPRNSAFYQFDERFMWIGYNETCFVGLSYLGVDLPNTDTFFSNWNTGNIIPKKILDKLILSDEVNFVTDGLELKTKEIATTIIEGIKGRGSYHYALFKKFLKYGITWSFEEQTLNVTGKDIKMVLEDLSNA